MVRLMTHLFNHVKLYSIHVSRLWLYRDQWEYTRNPSCTQTLGGTNSSLYSAGKRMYYTSIVEERFFSVLLTKIAVEDKTLNMPCKEVCIY